MRSLGHAKCHILVEKRILHSGENTSRDFYKMLADSRIRKEIRGSFCLHTTIFKILTHD